MHEETQNMDMIPNNSSSYIKHQKIQLSTRNKQ